MQFSLHSYVQAIFANLSRWTELEKPDYVSGENQKEFVLAEQRLGRLLNCFYTRLVLGFWKASERGLCRNLCKSDKRFWTGQTFWVGRLGMRGAGQGDGDTQTRPLRPPPFFVWVCIWGGGTLVCHPYFVICHLHFLACETQHARLVQSDLFKIFVRIADGNLCLDCFLRM